MRIVSWNVNGVRAALWRGLWRWIALRGATGARARTFLLALGTTAGYAGADPRAARPAQERPMPVQGLGTRALEPIAGDLQAATAPSRTPTAAAPRDLAPTLARLDHLVAGHTDRREEAEILSILRAASPSELDTIVARIDVHALVGSVEDRFWFFGPKNRTALLQLLTRERIGDLGPASRAALIDGLQRGRTGSGDERAILDVFLATRGAALTELKNAIDLGGGYHDLPQVIFHDIDDSAIRRAIVAHIQSEAARGGPAGRKVMSDIDDTFYANYKDDRYPSKTIYPGVRQFYRELGRTPSGDPPPVGPVFLTARPSGRGGLVEDLTHDGLRERGIETGVLLTGDLAHILGNQAIADKKYANFAGYQQLYPENTFVFVGDSGQGDAILSEHLRSAQPERLDAAFIHDVNAPPLGAGERARWAGKGVFFFDTYVGAAIAALERGMIDAGALRRMIAVTRTEMDAVPFASDAQRTARHADLERDVAAAETLLAGRRP